MLLPGLVVPPERPLIRVGDLCSLQEARVFKALLWGSENARRVDDLAREADLDGRALQGVLDHLAFKHRVPVGTSMRRPFGNYLIESEEDLALSVKLFTRRGLHSLGRASSLRRQALRDYLGHVQLNLDDLLEDES